MAAAASETGVCLLLFRDQPAFDQLRHRTLNLLQAVVGSGHSPHLDQLQEELAAYFAGQRTGFDVPVHPCGTPFQKEVWSELCKLPAGSPCSYGALARRLGKPDAVRAVAKANAENPLMILIPCHRVVGADGALTGYSGGLLRKQWLLDHERRMTGNVVPSLF